MLNPQFLWLINSFILHRYLMLWWVWHAGVSIYFGKISENKREMNLKVVLQET